MSYFNDDAKKIKKYKSSDKTNKSRLKYILPICATAVLFVGAGFIAINSFNESMSADNDFSEYTNKSKETTDNLYDDAESKLAASNTKQHSEVVETSDVLNYTLSKEENDYDNSNQDKSITDFSSHLYQIVNDSDITSFQEADKYCKSIGGHLATIQSQEENDYIYSLIISNGYSSAYFGLTDQDNEGTWKWTNGEPVNYLNWASSEPNSENSEENYAMFYYKYADGKWNDGRWSDNTTAFICEWDERNDQDDKTNNNIPESSEFMDFSNHSYKVIDNSEITSFQEANKYCKSIGGHLATIQSQEENDYIYSLIISNGYSSAYFGLTDQDNEGTWKWTNGEPVNYLNWASSEPNSENSEENYAMFYYKYADGKWNDGRWGDNTTAFICEWDE